MALYRVNHRNFDICQLAYDNLNQYDLPDYGENDDSDDVDFADPFHDYDGPDDGE